MKFKNLFAVIAVMFASFIQVGCGTSVPSTVGFNQQGNCPVGQTFLNGMCTYTGYTQQPGVNSCTSGPSYPGSAYGCQPGYILQGSSCVCQTGVNQPGVTNGQCQLPGYFFVQGSCYQQGPCMEGYAYVTPTGMCYRRVP